MNALTRRALIKQGVSMAVVTASGLGNIAFAQEPSALKTEKETPPFFQAAQWARKNDGIAVYVALGTDSGHYPAVIKQFFEKNFLQKYNVTANAFVEQTKTPGTVVFYFYKEAALKPVPFDIATSQENLDSIVAQYKAAKKSEQKK